MLRLSRMIGTAFLLVAVLVTAARLLGAPLGSGLAGVPIEPKREPVVLTLWYSTEKEQWLQAAIAQFAATAPTVDGRPIQVNLVGLGSNEIVERVAAQSWGAGAAPAAISPASQTQIDLLRARAGDVVLGGADAPQPLVVTPLVLVAWAERASALWPSGLPRQGFWQGFHDALIDDKGWKAHGGKEAWGLIKFGHTSPASSNSGMQTLALLSYGCHGKVSGLTLADVQDAECQAWVSDLERTVPDFAESTGAFMTDMVRFGPGKYDMATVYENVALEQSAVAKSRGSALKILYLPATLLSDHPFAILSGSWVAPEQQQAARALRSYLLSEPVQQLALRSGFRPSNPSVSIGQGGADNPFVSAKDSGVQIDLGPQAELPKAEVLQALVDAWTRQFGR